ncbi:HD-GYP domain-containing protein [Kosmotoga sp. DU53]|uniref:HD-GYP domain-containing protein n=1 Tax=Kosmotoga sp. DU53 TaxID=1310160 RepID=UPI0007C59028|nr:HD domain-containing phosphohydrolase [Kosmotoga sp. DU53]
MTENILKRLRRLAKKFDYEHADEIQNELKKILEKNDLNDESFNFAVALDFAITRTFAKKPIIENFTKEQLLEGIYELAYFFARRNLDGRAKLILSLAKEFIKDEDEKLPHVIKLRFLQMMTAFETGDVPETLKYYEKLSLLEKFVPRDLIFEYYNGMALVTAQLVKGSDPEKYYLLALKHAKDETRRNMVLYNLADYYYGRKEFELALRMLEKINVHDSPSTIGYYETMKLKIFLQLSDPQKTAIAVQNLEELNNSNKEWIDNWSSHIFLGHYYVMNGNIQRAKFYHEKLINSTEYKTNNYMKGETLVLDALIKNSEGKKFEGLRSAIKAFELLHVYKISSPHIEDLLNNLLASIALIFKELIEELRKKDNYTASHTLRVSMISHRIARKLGIDRTHLFYLSVGAMLHDFGKIEIPSEILNKPAKLTPEERAIIEQHPLIGAQYLKNQDFPREIVDVVMLHHERLDGSGYPLGLQGEKIPELAQIVAIADIYDALTTDRPYRKGLSSDDTLKYICEHGENIVKKEIIESLVLCVEEGIPQPYELDFEEVWSEIIGELVEKNGATPHR